MLSDGLLYHYCPTQTAFAILGSRTFRLSALSSANDRHEGRVLGKVFSRLMTATGLPKGVVELASVIVQSYVGNTEGFAFCLSESNDLLSQWRAYANDGSGIAIGFSPKLLEKDFGRVNFGSTFYELVKVNYGEDGLLSILEPIVQELQATFSACGEFARLSDGHTIESAVTRLWDRDENVENLFVGRDENDHELLTRLMNVLSPLHFLIYSTKPKSFHEEREWRLLRYRHRVALQDIEFFSDDRSIRPFISCLIADPAIEAIQEVVLGPKHQSDINWVRAFLASVGLKHVKVLRSTIDSYR
jgi:hypothetical protein